MRILRTLVAIAFALGASTGAAFAQDDERLRNNILAFYGIWQMIGAVGEYCFDADGYQPVYMSAPEGWRIRNLPHLDTVDAAAATLGGIDPAERAGIEAQAVDTMLQAARGNADVAAYCQNIVAQLESGELDLDTYYPDQFAQVRQAAGR